MNYEYKCTNSKCLRCNEILEIKKPLANYNTDEYCGFCNEKLKKLVSQIGYKNAVGFHGKQGQY